MASVAQDETVDATKPLIFFAFQIDGKMYDLNFLSRSIYAIAPDGTATLKVADAPLDLTATHLALGTYHADFTATGWAAGTYEIRWRYQMLNTDPIRENRQRFEVVDKSQFSTGSLYVGYCTTADLMTFTPFNTQSISAVQGLINYTSRRIETLTGRYFEPRLIVPKVNGRGIRGLALNEPIIGIQKVEIESGVTGLSISLTEVALDGLRIFARHLQGLLDPDDRDDPRIEIERFEGLIFQSLSIFPKGPQTIHVSGVFGYTDPDGGPMGVTPKPLFRAIGSLATKLLQDPFGQDRTVIDPFSVIKAKTRDQEVDYAARTSTEIIGLTGDPFVDMILLPYVRPPHYGAV